jgi:hypothetical protein
MIEWLIKKSQEFDDWFNNIFFPREPNIEPSLIVANKNSVIAQDDLSVKNEIEISKLSGTSLRDYYDDIIFSEKSNNNPSLIAENESAIPTPNESLAPKHSTYFEEITKENEEITKENISPHYLKNDSQFGIYRLTDISTGEKKVVAAKLNHPEDQLFLWRSLKDCADKGIKKDDVGTTIGHGVFGDIHLKTKFKVLKTFRTFSADLDVAHEVNRFKDKNEKLLEEFFEIKNLGAEKSVTFGLYNIKDPSKIVFNMPKLNGYPYHKSANFPNMPQIDIEKKPAWDQFFTDLYVLNKNDWSHSDLIAARTRSMQNMFTLDSGAHVMVDMDSPMKSKEYPCDKDQWLFASNSGNRDAIAILRNQVKAMASQENYNLSDDSTFLKTNIASGKIYVSDAIQQKMGINQIEIKSEPNFIELNKSSDKSFELHKNSVNPPLNQQVEFVI